MFVVRRWGFLTDDKGYIEVPRLNLFGWQIERETFEVQWYWILLPITIVSVMAARNLFRTALGRSFMAVRDQDIAAEAIGVNLTRAKVTAFAVSSSGFVGLSGALSAYYTETVTWERFTLDVSVLYLAMIIVGGLGSIAGSVYGAIFMMLLPACSPRSAARSATPCRSSPSNSRPSRTPSSAWRSSPSSSSNLEVSIASGAG
jgi:branched-chain amino acid transport system permease protein